MTTKITKATVKSFIRKNIDNLYINVKSEFDGMTDGCEYRDGGFRKARRDDDSFNENHTLGICGAWFVGQSRDYFRIYNENGMTGIEVSNCCGHFIVAIAA